MDSILITIVIVLEIKKYFMALTTKNYSFNSAETKISEKYVWDCFWITNQYFSFLRKVKKRTFFYMTAMSKNKNLWEPKTTPIAG